LAKNSVVKNSAFLYIRLILTLTVSLYTTRIVLSALGADDFGIYNVVTGVVTMFVFMKGALSSSSARFFAYELGKGKEEKLGALFKTSFTIHLLLGVILVVVLEVLGVWLINKKLNIPNNRLFATQCIFHASVFGTLFSIIQVPMISLIVAHERMKVYAYIGLFEALAKLLIATALTYSTVDKLILYGLSVNAVYIFTILIYSSYCKINFKVFKIKLYLDINYLKEMGAYTGWSMLSHIALVLRIQGVNLLLNVFFGPVVNAARGISFQINSVLTMLHQNLSTAITPQIIKNYSAGKGEGMLKLMYKGSKYSFLLVFVIAAPILLDTEFVLNIWLVDVPEYTIIFTRLIIVNCLFESFVSPLASGVLATGRVKVFHNIVAFMLVLNLPITYLLFKLGGEPYLAFVTSIIISVISLIVRLVLIKNELPFFSIMKCIKSVILASLLVSLVSLPTLIILQNIMSLGLLRFAALVLTSFTVTGSLSWFIIIDKEDKLLVVKKIKSLL